MIKLTQEEKDNICIGLSHLYWNKVLDSYIKTQTLSSEDYEDMNRDQKMVIQELKKHFARLDKPVINKKHHSLINKNRPKAV